MASHGSDTPTSPSAISHHTDTILCTFMHTTVVYHDLELYGFQTIHNCVNINNTFMTSKPHKYSWFIFLTKVFFPLMIL